MAVKSTMVRREEASAPGKKVPLKAVPRRTKLASEPASVVDVSLWGVPPAGASMFGILRKNDVGVGVRMRHEAPGTGVEAAEWPLDELSVDTVRSRWHGGMYTAIWLGVENGVRRSLGRGRKVVLRDDQPRLSPVDAKPAEASAPAPVVTPVAIAAGVGPQETIAMFMSMWSALQDTNRHAMTLERESYESRLKLQQDFYKEVTLLKTSGGKGGGELEKKVDAIIKRLDEDDDEDDAQIVKQTQGPTTMATILATHLPTLVQHLPDILTLARDALKNRKVVA